jgi:hypothetical protein
MAKISVPMPHNGWLPRNHQEKLWYYLRGGGKRAVAIWHRRAGKDEVCLHAMACAMLQRPGNYWYALPEYSQGRKVIWTAINPHTGKKRIDEAFPHACRTKTNDNEMLIGFGQSTFQIIGSDTYSSTVGASTAGIVFSEYALSNPAAWAYYRPILEENDGWAAFVSTPRGRNHAFQLFQHSARSPGWFSELLTARDTKALSDAALDEAQRELIAIYGQDQGTALFGQEYLCDWTASTLGAYYAVEMARVRNEGRILECDALPDRPVNYAWDLGIGDDTSVWAWQVQGAQLVILDHHATSGVGLEWWRDEIFRREKERGWRHGSDYVPHDAKIREWGTGRTRVETMAAMGLKPILVPMASIDDGINAVRRTLPLCVFHPRTEEGGISALEQYRREWDDDKKAFRASAVHDWTSHPADSFRYLSMSWKATPRIRPPEPEQRGWRIPPPDEVRRGGIIL